jgi:hypothetical protein
LFRVPAATPSGFTVRTVQMRMPPGAPSRRSRLMTAWPAVSFPWIDPTTSTRTAASGAPVTRTLMGAPRTECPIV